jgi:hypothetical protein
MVADLQKKNDKKLHNDEVLNLQKEVALSTKKLQLSVPPKRKNTAEIIYEKQYLRDEKEYIMRGYSDNFVDLFYYDEGKREWVVETYKKHKIDWLNLSFEQCLASKVLSAIYLKSISVIQEKTK